MRGNLGQGSEPGGKQGLPAQLVGLHVHHSTPAHSCRGGHSQVPNLHQGDLRSGRVHTNSIIRRVCMPEAAGGALRNVMMTCIERASVWQTQQALSMLMLHLEES